MISPNWLITLNNNAISQFKQAISKTYRSSERLPLTNIFSWINVASFVVWVSLNCRLVLLCYSDWPSCPTEHTKALGIVELAIKQSDLGSGTIASLATYQMVKWQQNTPTMPSPVFSLCQFTWVISVSCSYFTGGGDYVGFVTNNTQYKKA